MSGSTYKISRDLSDKLKIVKFICMILVVYIHSRPMPVFSYEIDVPAWVETVKTVLSDTIAAAAVPVFFLLSAFFLYAKPFSWTANIKKKIHSILIPYLIINTFWLLFFFVMSRIPQLSAYFASEQYQINTWRDVLNAYLGNYPLYYPFWFLKDLFLLNLISPVLWLAAEKMPIVTAVACFFVYSSGMIPGYLFHGGKSIVYWMMGLYIVRTGLDFGIIDRFRYPDILIGYIAATVLYYFKYMPILIYVGIAFVFFYRSCGYLVDTYRNSRFFQICVSQTFIIYAFHEFYEAMAKKAVMGYLPQTGIVQVLEYLILPLVIIAICIFAGEIMKRRISKVYNFITGHRDGTF